MVLIPIILLFSTIASTNSIQVQLDNNQVKARKLGAEAIHIMDLGRYEEAIRLLVQASELEPDFPGYQYEIAFAYYLQKDYNSAKKILKKLLKEHEPFPDTYGLLGNVYDLTGKYSKSIKTYKAGLKLFPNSGKLYLEMGVAHTNHKKYEEAILTFENGIRADPGYPSNYFKLAKIFCSIKDPLWGLIYGEIFINLEPNTQRTKDISQRLYSTYLDNFNMTEEDGRQKASVTLVKQYNLDEKHVKNDNLPFSFIFETTMGLDYALHIAEPLDLEKLSKLRVEFVKSWIQKNRQKLYPNVLLERLALLMENNLLEAYNYWLFKEGDPQGSMAWFSNNQEKLLELKIWLNQNPMDLSPENFFIRTE